MSDGTPSLVQVVSRRVLDCGARGRAFAVYPAVKPLAADVASEAPTSIPGAYPVTVRFRGNGRKGEFLVVDGRLNVLDEEFEGFDLINCKDDGDTFAVQVFSSPHAGFFPAGSRSSVPVAVQNTAVALATTSPNAATDGWPLRPGMSKFTVFYSGTDRVNRLWVRQLNGTWFDTKQDWTTATDGPMQPLQVDVPGDRFTLVASGASQSVRIEGSFLLG